MPLVSCEGGLAITAGINCIELIYGELIHVFQAIYPLTSVLTRLPGLPDVVLARLSPRREID